MKELPATIILRTFNFDTLAVTCLTVWRLTKGWAESATSRCSSSLWGIIPVVYSPAWQLRHSRPGSGHTLTLRACRAAGRKIPADISRLKEHGLPFFWQKNTGYTGMQMRFLTVRVVLRNV